MSRQQIESLLNDADAALKAGMTKEAERLYDQAADLAVTDDDVLFSRALEGIEQARNQGQATPVTSQLLPTEADAASIAHVPAVQGSQALAGIDLAALEVVDPEPIDWRPLAQARKHQEPIYELIETRKLLDSEVKLDEDGADLSICYAEALDSFRRQALTAAKKQLDTSTFRLEQGREAFDLAFYEQGRAALEAALEAVAGTALPNDIGRDAATSRTLATLRSEFVDAKIRARQQEYSELRQNIAAEIDQAKAAHAQYAYAKTQFEQADYAACIATLRAIQTPHAVEWPPLTALLAAAEERQAAEIRAAEADDSHAAKTMDAQRTSAPEPADNAAAEALAASPAAEPSPPAQADSAAPDRLADAAPADAPLLETLTPSVMPTPPETSEEPVKPKEFTTLDNATQKRVEQLVQEAEFFLSKPSNDNYKKAVFTYKTILAFSDIAPSQRKLYEKKFIEIQAKQADFLAKYGELMTARMLAGISDEVIATKKLLNAGELEDPDDPDGKNLDDKLTDLLMTMRKKVQDSADEQVNNAKSALRDGLRYLEDGQFDTAISYYNVAIRLVNGSDFDRETSVPETNNAITSIKNTFANVALKASQNIYTEAIASASDLKQRVQRIRPLYDRAELEIEKDAYAKAVDVLDRALKEGGTVADWTRVSELRDLAYTRWERQALVSADGLLADARLAKSRADLAALQEVVRKLRALEPHLNSSHLAQKQAAGEELLNDLILDEKQAREQRIIAEQQIQIDAALAEQLLASNSLDDAERKIRALLAQPLGKQEGQHLLHKLIHKKVKRSVRETETLIYGTDSAAMHRQRDHLTHYLNDIGEVSSVREKRSLQEDIELAVAQLKQRITDIEMVQGWEKHIAEVIKQAAKEYDDSNYEAALKLLDDALKVTPKHPEATRVRLLYRAEWLDTLQRKMRQLLSNSAPKVDVLEQTLSTIKANLDYADPDVAIWQKTIDRLLARRNGLDAFSKGEYQRAIDQLVGADGADVEVAATLKDARFKVGEIEFNNQHWGDAVRLLMQAETSHPRVKALLDRASSEFEIQQAVQCRQNQQFDQALRFLQQAQSHGITSLSERIAQEQERTTRARFAAQRLATLREKVTHVLDRRTELLACIDDLRRERESLTGDDDLRRESLHSEFLEQINTWQDMYKQLVSSERAGLIRDGRSALHNNNPVAALESFNKALALSATKEDSEVDTLIKQAQGKLIAARDQLVATIKTFLRSQQMTLADCNQLLAQAKAGLNWDPANHQPLVDAAAELEKTHSLLSHVEQYLKQARTSWFNARQKGELDFAHTEGLLQQAGKEFDNKPSNHADLDLGSNQNMYMQMNEDKAAIRAAAKQVQELTGLIKGPVRTTTLDNAQRAYEALQQAEESILKITTELSIKVNGQFMPPRLAERFPKQYEMLKLLVERINDGQHQLNIIEDIETWRAERNRVTTLSTLFTRWNTEDRFGLQSTLIA